MRSPFHFFFKHTTQHHSIDWKRLIYSFTAANTLAQLFIPFWCSNLIRGYALHLRIKNTQFSIISDYWHFREQNVNPIWTGRWRILIRIIINHDGLKKVIKSLKQLLQEYYFSFQWWYKLCTNNIMQLSECNSGAEETFPSFCLHASLPYI